jgi:hypothetical protein
MVAGIEDIQGYYDLIQNLFPSDAARVQPFTLLASRIPPEVLGQVQRVHKLIRLLVKNSVQSRTRPPSSEHATTLATTLTERFFSHNYHISFPECKELGLPIEPMPGTLQTDIDILSTEYRRLMEVGKDLTMEILPGQEHARAVKMRAFIETSTKSYVFKSDVIVDRDKNAQVNDLGWQEERNEQEQVGT